jgi:hypothetical protein
MIAVKRHGWIGIGVAAVAVMALCGAVVAATDQEDWPDWVTEQESLHARIAAVNEGELSFLETRPVAAVHHHSSRVLITEGSLLDGWVLMQQCHDNLDQVSSAQIVFHPERSRALQLVSFRNVEQARAEAHSIQLRGIGPASQVCISVETRALHLDDGDVFELHNGPFMRRFLDGYYPLHVSLQIDHPASLVLADFVPGRQPGFEVSEQSGRIRVEALFEGELRTRFRFLSR